MNGFQIVTLTCVAAVWGWSCWQLAGMRLRGRMWLLRTLVAVVTALAVARPDWIQLVANFLGIGRGTDIVLYAFVLAFLVTSFFFYSRWLSLQQQVTELIRMHAIENARHGSDGPDFDPTTGSV